MRKLTPLLLPLLIASCASLKMPTVGIAPGALPQSPTPNIAIKAMGRADAQGAIDGPIVEYATVDVTCTDVSRRQNANGKLEYFRGMCATEDIKDTMQHKDIQCASQIAAIAEPLTGGSALYRKAIAARNLKDNRLGGVDYENKQMHDDVDQFGIGFWFVDDYDRFYQVGDAVAEAEARYWTSTGIHIQVGTDAKGKPITKTPAQLCVTLLTQDQRNYLNVGIVGDHCDFNTPAPFTIAAHLEPDCDTEITHMGMLTTRTNIPDLSPAADALLQRLLDAHMAVTVNACEGGTIVGGSVSAAQRDFENECGKYWIGMPRAERTRIAICRHSRQLKPFTGRVDPRWTKAQECAFRYLEDDGMMPWAAVLRAPEPAKIAPFHRWVTARTFDDMHHMSHEAMNYKDPRPGCDKATSLALGCALFRPFCNAKIATCPRLAPDAWAAQYIKLHPEKFLQVANPAPAVM